MRLNLTGILKRSGLAFMLSFLILILFSQPAYAHPDFPIADSVLQVPSGGHLEFPLSIHFHRVFGTFEVTRPAGGTITALLMDDDTFKRYAAGQPSSPLYSSGRTDRGKLNYAIACCRVLVSGEDRQLTYTPYHLVLDNTASPSSVSVRLQAVLLHDGLAVIVHVGEPFGIIPMIGFLGAIGVGMSVFMRRKIRAATLSSPSKVREGPKILLLSLGSLASFVVLSLLVVSMGIAGMSSYGGSFIDGLVVTQKYGLDTPSLGRYDLEEVLIILSWLLALLFWLGAFGAAVNRRSRLAGMIGIGEGLGWLGFWLLVAVNYGSVFVPAVLAGFISLPHILGGLYLIPKRQRIVAKSS